MSDPEATALQFNALTDAWLPLVQKDGGTVWASPVEVLCGEKDGVDLDYPRDDFRVYARLLLSALVQALFPAKNKAELALRLERPLSRKEVEARIDPIRSDFDLFGPTPFLQVTPPPNAPTEGGAAPFVFPGEDIFKARIPVDAVSLPIALVSIFAEQTYAGKGGRGYPPGIAGTLGALTLLDPGSVRAAAWANTLTSETVRQKYAADPDCPWTNVSQSDQLASSIGIVGGLFFQPRGIWLVPSGYGRCSFSGAVGRLVKRSPYLGKSRVARSAVGPDERWLHPCAPLVSRASGLGPVKLSPGRPIWTGLGQLLHPISESPKKRHPNEGPALVLQQWRSLSGKPKRPLLLVLDFDRKDASVRGRFFEAFPLLVRGDTIEQLRALVADAQDVQRSLVQALTRAHDDRKQGGFARADAESSFWASSEAPFLDWLQVVTSADEPTEENDAQVDRAGKTMRARLRKTALEIFDAHVALSEFDPRKAEGVAKARRNLVKSLYPKPAGNGPIASSSTEVSR